MRIDTLDISASGLKAQRIRMEAVANNLANIETTSTEHELQETDSKGNVYIRHIPYRRRVPVFSIGMADQADARLGVTVPAVVDDMSTDLRREYRPNHPHAVMNPEAEDFGYVYFPNVDPLMETVDMIVASRAYEANIQAIQALSNMGEASLRILA